MLRIWKSFRDGMKLIFRIIMFLKERDIALRKDVYRILDYYYITYIFLHYVI